ncbi:MAG: ABC transporter permease subunit [Phycisphaerae bacterium]|nr:ABC transporter permease subunit [Phycisphaerae bacterium]
MTQTVTPQTEDTATTAPAGRRGFVDLLARPMHWLTGPILDKELRVASRRKRLYLLRTLYLVLMALILVPIWHGAMDTGYHRYSGDGASMAYRMADLGRALVPVIVWIQYVAVQLVAMLAMSTSISDEISRRTLGTLLTTPMNAWQLVMGKLASRLVQCVGLLAMSLPILALLTVFGGVEWSFVLIGLALTLSTLLIVASVTMVFSIRSRKPYVVFLESGLTLAILFGGSLLFMGWFAFAFEGYENGQILAAVATMFHPLVSLMKETAFHSGGGGTGGIWLAPWWMCVMANVVFSALVLSWCVRIVRRAALASAMGMSMSEMRRMDRAARTSAIVPAVPLPPIPTPHTAAPEAVPPPLSVTAPPPPATAADESTGRIKSLSGNPVYWKDTVRRRFGKRAIIIAALVLGLQLFTYVVAVTSTRHGDTFPRELHSVYVVVLGILGALIAVVVSASGIPAEREARSWDMVLASPLTDGQIVWGKFLATLRRLWLAYVPLGLHVGLFTLSGSLHPIILLHVAAIVAGSATFIAAMGVLIGTYVRRTTAAMVAMLLLFLFLWLGALLLTAMVENSVRSYRYETPVTKAVAGCNPFVQLIVTGGGSTTWVYWYDDENNYRWPSGGANIYETTFRILFISGGYMAFAALAYFLARGRLRRVKS